VPRDQQVVATICGDEGGLGRETAGIIVLLGSFNISKINIQTYPNVLREKNGSSLKLELENQQRLKPPSSCLV
jgi:hypothetical protein